MSFAMKKMADKNANKSGSKPVEMKANKVR